MQVETKSISTPPSGERLRRSLPENAFTPHFLERARRRPDAEEVAECPWALRAVFAGPWEVEPVRSGDGTVHAVSRRAEPLAGGGSAVALFVRRPEALLGAAALTALATPSHLSLNGDKRPGRRPYGFPVHDGTRHVGHLSRPEEGFLASFHALRCLAADPDAAALFLEALDPETLAILGRAATRRLA